MTIPVQPKLKKGKSLMSSALESGLDSLNDPAVLAQLHQPVRPPLTGSESTPNTAPKPTADSELRLDQLEPNPDQARTHFDLSELEELAESIRQKGVLQPLLVRPLAGERYQIQAGERRWRAAKLAGLISVPVYIREFDDRTSQEISLVENLHRSDLNRVEKLEKVLQLLALRFEKSRDWAVAVLRQAWAVKQGRRASRPVADPEELLALNAYLVQLGVGLSNLVVSSMPCLAWPPEIYRAVATGWVGIRYAELILKQPDEAYLGLLELARKLDFEAFAASLVGETSKAKKPDLKIDAQTLKGLKSRFGKSAKVVSRNGQTIVTLTAKNDQEWQALRKALDI